MFRPERAYVSWMDVLHGPHASMDCFHPLSFIFNIYYIENHDNTHEHLACMRPMHYPLETGVVIY
jgi:hypothetical protein